MKDTSIVETEIQKQIVEVEAKLRKHNLKVISYKGKLMSLVKSKQEAALQRIGLHREIDRINNILPLGRM